MTLLHLLYMLCRVLLSCLGLAPLGMCLSLLVVGGGCLRPLSAARKPAALRAVVPDRCGPGPQRPDITYSWPPGFFARAGDCNCDGRVDFDDIDPFVLRLTDVAAYCDQYPECRGLAADCNEDCRVDFDDIDPFVGLLVKGERGDRERADRTPVE